MITADVFEKAILFAAKVHKKQRRKGDGRPYILHPFAVMYKVNRVKKSKNIFLLGASSALHDVVEDCGVSLKKIAKKFGYHIASIVQELTIDDELCAELGKTEYLCRSMEKMSSYALVIKLCDRLDNICDMREMSESFQQRYVEQTMIILARLKKRKLTKTHEEIIKLINDEVNKYVYGATTY